MAGGSRRASPLGGFLFCPAATHDHEATRRGIERMRVHYRRLGAGAPAVLSRTRVSPLGGALREGSIRRLRVDQFQPNIVHRDRAVVDLLTCPRCGRAHRRLRRRMLIKLEGQRPSQEPVECQELVRHDASLFHLSALIKYSLYRAADFLIRAMNTTNPTTRSAHSFLKFRDHSLDVIFSRFRRLDGDSPAYPFIACERRKTLPCRERLRIGNEGFP